MSCIGVVLLWFLLLSVDDTYSVRPKISVAYFETERVFCNKSCNFHLNQFIYCTLFILAASLLENKRLEQVDALSLREKNLVRNIIGSCVHYLFRSSVWGACFLVGSTMESHLVLI